MGIWKIPTTWHKFQGVSLKWYLWNQIKGHVGLAHNPFPEEGVLGSRVHKLNSDEMLN